MDSSERRSTTRTTSTIKDILTATTVGFPWAFLFSTLLFLTLSVVNVHAYIPALPSNDSTTLGNYSATALLNLNWYKGTYSGNVSYQLVGADSTGYSEGALMGFSELHLLNETTTTPWIALVACDANATNASQEIDIFTAARDRGAVAALLYSVYSERCIINSGYADPQNFDQIMDIFSSPNLVASQTIQTAFRALNQTKYRDFNATLLNATASLVNDSLTNPASLKPNYLFAQLIAANATQGPSAGNNSGDTGNANGMDGSGDGSGSGGGGGGGGGDGNGKSSLAMIILYAITGCVSALFCVVIVSGAIRAIRHPERYGPRAGFGVRDGHYGAPQSRARGLTRAILDTFPVVKFGRAQEGEMIQRGAKDVESASSMDASSNGVGATAGNRRQEGGGEEEERGDVELRELRELPAVGLMMRGEGGECVEGATEEQEVDVTESALASHHVDPSARRASTSSLPSPSLSSPSPLPTPRPRRPQARASMAEASTASATDADLVPDAIGRETCPICIVDFEEGDDLRVLPCEGHHRFHQQCVDPWLLELSSSCPLCRQDFHVLETMMSSDGHGPPEHGDSLEPPHPHFASGTNGSRPLSTAGARLSRYLRLARRTRRRNREGMPHGYDPTNPPMPVAPETSL
ncbi:hypothetical protein BDY19DRAFT_458827 [Irpex rosettiformis]|uniref:Uncharacterized protein n=1 Tax=Irpex rosettiformis TaxID=378272 RepID=A0ACB8TSZ5_9APHY|nr:hypothetical protein BDY19DRAFT_458827 [Irpex rosettiformis]